MDNWDQIVKFTPDDGAASDYFGSSISIEGDRVLVGSIRDDDNGSQSGSAYLFEFDSRSSSWVQTMKLDASGAAAAIDNPNNAAASDYFSGGVSLGSKHMIGGLVGDDTMASNAGAACGFTFAPSSASVSGPTANTDSSSACKGCSFLAICFFISFMVINSPFSANALL